MQTYDPQIKVDQFADMGLPKTLLQALTAAQITTPTLVQAQAIPAALKGLDMVTVAQTGSGKTLAYLLPVLAGLSDDSQARALILTPSRETAEQVYRVINDICRANPLPVALAVTGMPVADQAKMLKKNPRVIVATPGRMGEHLRGNKLLLQGLGYLVIDEADRMLELGFEEQLKFLQSTLRGDRQTLMFAASFGPRAEPIAELFLKPDAVMIRTEGAERAVETLKQTVYFMTWPQKNLRLVDDLKNMKGGVIVFTDAQETCMKVGRLLAHHELSADFVHGNMQPGHRNRILREFREQRIQILVTTDLLARGLDIPHVDHIVSYDLPYKAEDFLHRIGRTARAGREGHAITFVTPSDGRTFRKIKGYLSGAHEETLASGFKFDDRG